MGTVFISYRRGDTAGEARALYHELTSRLGEDSVFMDVDSIALGFDFRQALHERLESCELMLVLIGRDWVDVKTPSGARRLDDPTDFVALEIEAALKRNIPVTPVLLQGAQMPTLEQLPANLKDFAYRNGFELSHSRWESDVQEMFKRLHLAGPAQSRAESPPLQADIPRAEAVAAPRPARKPWIAMAAAVLALAAIAGGGKVYYDRAADEHARVEQQRLASEKARAEAEASLAASKADAEAKLAATKAEAERAQAEAVAANARAEATRAEQERLAAEQQARADADAKAAARKAEAEKAQTAAAARAANARAVAQAEREKAAAAALRAEWAQAAAAQAERERERERAERARIAAAAQEESDRAAAAARAERGRAAAADRAQREIVISEQERRQRIAMTLQADRDRLAALSAQRNTAPVAPPDMCKQGFVWREAYPGDRVCVTPMTRAQAANDNRQAPARRELGGGPSGPNTCRQGFVWREARPGDLVCVAPPTRAETAMDNRLDGARRL